MTPTPVTVTDDGTILWRGFYKSREGAVRLAEQFEQINAVDYFSPLARQYAADLRAAIGEHDQIHQHQEIAA